MPVDSRPPPRHRPHRPAQPRLSALFIASAAVLVLAGLASCGGERAQKSSQGTSAPARTPSTSARPTTPAPSTRAHGLDPKFGTCAEANAAGYGPYVRGADPEYAWYEDRDQDGIDCERGSGSAAPQPGDGLDPRFATCAKANAAGYGPYYEGTDPEYAWYKDRDRDGVDCEPRNGVAPSSPAPSESPPTSTPSEEPSTPVPSEEPSDSGPSMEPSPSEPSDEPSAPDSSGRP
ncbi:excalibur calcium-binding domain-containing protein [Actinomadura sp. GTD37]|uniref:excalibur calcium-binding domain-containing protein n=1 Tax=Actinomadura sp. GTD37 TaxID=1778030 RepID=UPI0035BF063F